MGDRRHCACIFESTSGPPVQWCSHHATLRKENERLTAEVSDMQYQVRQFSRAAKITNAQRRRLLEIIDPVSGSPTPDKRRCSYCDHHAVVPSWECEMCQHVGQDVPVTAEKRQATDG